MFYDSFCFFYANENIDFPQKKIAYSYLIYFDVFPLDLWKQWEKWEKVLLAQHLQNAKSRNSTIGPDPNLPCMSITMTTDPIITDPCWTIWTSGPKGFGRKCPSPHTGRNGPSSPPWIECDELSLVGTTKILNFCPTFVRVRITTSSIPRQILGNSLAWAFSSSARESYDIFRGCDFWNDELCSLVTVCNYLINCVDKGFVSNTE